MAPFARLDRRSKTPLPGEAGLLGNREPPDALLAHRLHAELIPSRADLRGDLAAFQEIDSGNMGQRPPLSRTELTLPGGTSKTTCADVFAGIVAWRVNTSPDFFHSTRIVP